MAFTLASSNGHRKVKYSLGEQRLFTLLSKDDRPRTSADLTKLYYGTRGVPFHGRKIVIGLLASLINKAEHNNEPFRVCKTNRSGPISMSFWLEKR